MEILRPNYISDLLRKQKSRPWCCNTRDGRCRKPQPTTIGEVYLFIIPDFPRKGKGKYGNPHPKKLPSGSWFVRVTVDGKTHSITRATKKECLNEAMAVKSGAKELKKRNPVTLTKAIDNYIEARENVLSPSTIRGYRAIQRLRFQTSMHKFVENITADQWQRIVNAEAKLCSAKTLKNAWGFLSSVIFDATGKKVSVRLPQVVANDLPYLTAEQIPPFLEAIKGDFCEIAILLGLSGLRRSEIMAVKWKDIDLDAGCIYVQGSAVHDENGQLIYRAENKNTSSRRTVPFLLPQLREAVLATQKKTEYAVTCTPGAIYKAAIRACRKAGVTETETHGLRHSFASLAYHLGIPEAVTMKAGGWSDIYTMRKIYTKISEKDISAHGQAYEAFFENLDTGGKNCNEKQNNLEP